MRPMALLICILLSIHALSASGSGVRDAPGEIVSLHELKSIYVRGCCCDPDDIWAVNCRCDVTGALCAPASGGGCSNPGAQCEDVDHSGPSGAGCDDGPNPCNVSHSGFCTSWQNATCSTAATCGCFWSLNPPTFSCNSRGVCGAGDSICD